MEALYSNPDVPERQKAQLSANYTAYVLHYESDPDKAIKIVLRVIKNESVMPVLYTLLIE